MANTAENTSNRRRAGLATVAIVAALTTCAVAAADWGALRMDRQSLQQAVNAAALAGASFLPADPIAARQTAARYAAANLENCPALAGGSICPGAAADGGYPSLDARTMVDATVSANRLALTVKVSRQVPILVVPFLRRGHQLDAGLQSYRTVTATATATIDSASMIDPRIDANNRGALTSVVYQGREPDAEALRPVQQNHSEQNDLGVYQPVLVQ